MKTEFLWLFILLIHFLGDFGMQTHEQATNKSSSDKWLFYHVAVYSMIWFLATWIWFGSADKAAVFALVTFMFHFLTDFATSRIGKPFWDKGDFHNGFVVVGFDQILHYIQLYLTFSLISSQMIS